MLLALTIVKAIISGSVFFVWVVRYQNIVKEFKEFDYPEWLRDIVGITKVSSLLLILAPDPMAIKVGSVAIGSLMFAAMTTHLMFKNPFYKMWPSTFLFLLTCFLLINTP